MLIRFVDKSERDRVVQWLERQPAHPVVARILSAAELAHIECREPEGQPEERAVDDVS